MQSNDGSKSTIATSASNKSSNSTQRGAMVDMRAIMEANTLHAQENKRKDMNYVLDAEGNPTGVLLETLIFSDLMKHSVTGNKKNEEIKFFSKCFQPSAKLPSKIDESKKPGSIPVAHVFHAISNRERRGIHDDGLDDDDLTAADGIVRKTKVQERRVSRRRSFVYKNIRLTKGEFSFPHKTYRPKVQVAYRVPLGQAPQAVIIERLHRAYRRTDINMVLQSLGVEIDDLIPLPHYGETNERFYQENMFRNRVWINGVEKREYISKFNELEAELAEGTFKNATTGRLHHPASDESLSYPSTASGDSSDGSGSGEEKKPKKSGEHSSVHPFIKAKPPFGCMFPLDLFDNEEFDIRTGVQWINLGYDKKHHSNYPIPGKAFLPYTIQDAIERNTPTFSELTYERLLKKNDRLEAFRVWLMNSRYRRTVVMSGKDPDSITTSQPNIRQLASIARTSSVVPSIFPSFNVDYMIKLGYDDDKRTSGVTSDMSMTTLLKFAEVVEEEEVSSTTDIEAKKADLTENMQFLAKELLGDHYKTQVTTESEKESDADGGNSGDELAKKKMGKDYLGRSESLLSEIFSDVSLAQLLNLELNPQLSLSSMLEMDVEEEEEGKVGRRKRKFLTNDPSKVAQFQIDGDYGYTFPTSPDIDSYDDGFDDIVFDYSKMKKTHTYEWHWVDVAVFDYNKDTRKYLVRSIHPPFIFAWVAKPYLCFDGEDPVFHGQRIRDAVIRRFEFENIMRYNLYVDCLPLTDFVGIPRLVIKNITHRAQGTSGKVQNIIVDKQVMKVKQELDLVYKRIHAQEKFEHIIQRHPRVYKPWLKVPDKETNFEPLNLWEEVGPRYLAKNHFIYKVSKLAKRSVIFTCEPFKALREVIGFCQDALDKPFILLDVGPLHIDEFKKAQEDNMEKLLLYLKDDWFASILTTIRRELGRIPNSWFDMKELRWDIFMMSKLSKFLNVIHFVMSDTIRTMVLSSLRGFLNQIKEMTITCEGRSTFPWGTNLSESKYPTPPGLRPILKLQLHMDEAGPRYTQMLFQHCTIIEELLHHVLETANGVPRLLPIIMPQFLFGDKEVLVELLEDEPEFVRLRTEIIKYIRLAMRPVDSYAQKFRRYQYAIRTSVQGYLKEWNSENRTVTEVRKAVDQLRGHIEMFQEELPTSIEITAFKIVVDVVKQSLIKKKSALMAAVLENFAAKLKASVHKIKDEYADIEHKLTTRSEDIEEVMELKTYTEMVPANIARLEESMQKVLKDYELFERFAFSISNEDSDLKWNVAIQSAKALRMAHDAITWLEEDYDRLLKAHQQDLSIFSDQVDSAILGVGGLAAFIELEKAVDVSAEVKKVWLNIKELYDQSMILNKRQVIFGMQATTNKALDSLIRDIEPFKNLWFTAADWIRAKESVSKDILDKIDVIALTSVIQDGGKIISKCIKYFQGADTIQHIAQEVLHQIKTHKHLVPLLQTFKNPGMRQRHWTAISEQCGFPVVARGSEKFKNLLDKGIEEHVDFIAKIGEQATKEHEIEYSLDTMEKNLKKYALWIKDDKENGISLVVVSEEALDAVSQFIAKTEALSISAYREAFDERLALWERKINLLKHNLEKWFDSQHSWLELQPTFFLPDVAKKMPLEHKLFQNLDWIWRRLVRRARLTTELQELATDGTLVSGLTKFNNLMKKMHEALEERKNIQAKGSDSDD